MNDNQNDKNNLNIEENQNPVETQYVDEFGNRIDPSLIDANGNYIGNQKQELTVEELQASSTSAKAMDDKELLTGMVTFDYNNVPITDIVVSSDPAPSIASFFSARRFSAFFSSALSSARLFSIFAFALRSSSAFLSAFSFAIFPSGSLVQPPIMVMFPFSSIITDS